jgi:hypothetical protein
MRRYHGETLALRSVGRKVNHRSFSPTPIPKTPSHDLTLPNWQGSSVRSVAQRNALRHHRSQVPATLTEQIPIVAPVRMRVVEFGRKGNGDSPIPGLGSAIQIVPRWCSTSPGRSPWMAKFGRHAHGDDPGPDRHAASKASHEGAVRTPEVHHAPIAKGDKTTLRLVSGCWQAANED